MINETYKKDNKAVKVTVVFALLVVVGLAAWLVFENLLMPPKVQLASDLAKLAKDINPELETQVITVMKSKRLLTQNELADFTIYLTDTESESARNNKENFAVRLLKPAKPLDLGFYSLVAEQEKNASQQSQETEQIRQQIF